VWYEVAAVEDSLGLCAVCQACCYVGLDDDWRHTTIKFDTAAGPAGCTLYHAMCCLPVFLEMCIAGVLDKQCKMSARVTNS
jgi:hypothetical protein